MSQYAHNISYQYQTYTNLYLLICIEVVVIYFFPLVLWAAVYREFNLIIWINTRYHILNRFVDFLYMLSFYFWWYLYICIIDINQIIVRLFQPYLIQLFICCNIPVLFDALSFYVHSVQYSTLATKKIQWIILCNIVICSLNRIFD